MKFYAPRMLKAFLRVGQKCLIQLLVEVHCYYEYKKATVKTI